MVHVGPDGGVGGKARYPSEADISGTVKNDGDPISNVSLILESGGLQSL